VSLIVGETKTFLFLESTIRSKVLHENPLKWWKVHEAQFVVVGYLVHQILGIVWNQIISKNILSITGILTRLQHKCQLGTQNLKSTCVDFQKLTKWSRFGCESFVTKSFDDFVGVDGGGVWRSTR